MLGTFFIGSIPSDNSKLLRVVKVLERPI